MTRGQTFPPYGDRDNAATELGRYWDAVVAGGVGTPAVAPELSDVVDVVRRLHAEPRDPAPVAVHDGIRALIEAHPAWWFSATAPATAESALVSRNGHAPIVAKAPGPITAIPPRPLRRLWPVVELVGIAAAILGLLYVAFGRDQQAEQPTPTVVLTPPGLTPTTAPFTPTPASDAVGDWPMLGGGPSRSGGADRSIPARTPAMRWTTSLAPNIRFPVAAGDAVYVTDGGTLYALDAATGAERWRFDLGVAPSIAGANPPAIVAGAVYVASADGTVFAIDAATGRERWRKMTREKITTAVAVAQETVFVGTVDGNLYALDAATGEPRWSVATGPMTLSSPVVANGIVLVAVLPDRLLAFEVMSGIRLWGKTISTGMRSVAVGEGIAVVASRSTGGNQFVALDATNGDLRWSNGLGSDPPPVIAGGLVYTASPEGVDALNAATGGQLWGFEATLKVVQFAVAGDGLLLSREDGAVIAMNAVTGAERWRIATGGNATGTAVGAGVLYVAHKDGTLAAYQ